MKTLYHGTSSVNLACIRSIGLVPEHAKGGDAWARDHHHDRLAARSAKREPSVFVIDDITNAERFARFSCEEMGGEPLLLTLHVPAHVFETFVVDEVYEHGPDGEPHAWRAHSIPAVYIVEVQPVPKMSEQDQFMNVLAQLLAEARS
jgi:hypothetical protein